MTYDPTALCESCGKPVMAASMSGTKICPWCDMGKNRDGTDWGLEHIDVDKMVEDLAKFLKRPVEEVREIMKEVIKELE